MVPTCSAPAREIVRRSGSNLAFTLSILPGAIRRDMEIFYAFCRVVDDLADEPGPTEDERRAGLNHWRALVKGEAANPAPGIESEFTDLLRRRAPRTGDLLAIIEGMEMDLAPLRFSDKTQLRRYCYHVASAVGLVSVGLFGATDPAAREYAEQLGYALQWTNILRDVGEDAAAGKLYLPEEDLRRFGVTPEAVLSGEVDRAKFGRLMKHEAAVARAHFRESLAVFTALPKSDQHALRSAELMRRIYSAILDRMEQDGFRVFEKRYRLGKATMVCELLRAKTGR